jgi:hypothetical protein
MRICPFKGCDKEIDPTLFACLPHWRLLTKDQQAEIHDAYRGWKRGEVSADELRGRQQAVLDEVQSRRGKR